MGNAFDKHKHYPDSEYTAGIIRGTSRGSALRSGTDAIEGYYNTETL